MFVHICVRVCFLFVFVCEFVCVSVFVCVRERALNCLNFYVAVPFCVCVVK